MLQNFYALKGTILALREHPRVKRVLSHWQFLLIVLTLSVTYLVLSPVFSNPFTIFGDSFLIRSSLYHFNSDGANSLLQFFSVLANSTAYGLRKIILLIHLINASLLFSVVKKYGDRLGNKETYFPAFFGMLLFVSSPIIIENVAWISTIKETLGATLVLTALFFLEKFVQDKKHWFLLVVFFIQCLLVFINPFSFIIPILVWLYLTNEEEKTWDNVFLWVFPFILVSLLYLNFDSDFAYWFASLKKSTVGFFSGLNLRFQALGFYVSSFFLGTGRVIDYGWSLDFPSPGANKIVNFAFAFLLLIGSFFCFYKKNWRVFLLPVLLFSFAIIFDLRFLALRFEAYSTGSSDVIIRSIVADRYLYLPFILFLAFFLPLLGKIWAKIFWRQFSLLVIGIVVISGALTQHQLLENWTRNSSLIKHTYDITKFNYDALMRVGKTLENSGELAYTDTFYMEALTRYPDQVVPIERMIHYYYHVGKNTLADKLFLGAIKENKKLSLDSFLEVAAANLLIDNVFDAEIVLLLGIKNYPENKLLLEQYSTLLKKKKLMERDAFEVLGHYASFKNNFEEAQRYLLKAYSIDPNNPRMKDATRLYLDALKLKILKENQAKLEAQKGNKNGNTKQDTKNP